MKKEKILQVHGENDDFLSRWQRKVFDPFVGARPGCSIELLFHSAESFDTYHSTFTLTSVGYKITWDEQETAPNDGE